MRDRRNSMMKNIFTDLSDMELSKICTDVASSRINGERAESLVPYAKHICENINLPGDNSYTLREGLDTAREELLMELIDRFHGFIEEEDTNED